MIFLRYLSPVEPINNDYDDADNENFMGKHQFMTEQTSTRDLVHLQCYQLTAAMLTAHPHLKEKKKV
jgi:4-hydroxy-L-threonine phosphate dehydrogenase PdxA